MCLHMTELCHGCFIWHSRWMVSSCQCSSGCWCSKLVCWLQGGRWLRRLGIGWQGLRRSDSMYSNGKPFDFPKSPTEKHKSDIKQRFNVPAVKLPSVVSNQGTCSGQQTPNWHVRLDSFCFGRFHHLRRLEMLQAHLSRLPEPWRPGLTRARHRLVWTRQLALHDENTWGKALNFKP